MLQCCLCWPRAVRRRAASGRPRGCCWPTAVDRPTGSSRRPTPRRPSAMPPKNCKRSSGRSAGPGCRSSRTASRPPGRRSWSAPVPTCGEMAPELDLAGLGQEGYWLLTRGNCLVIAGGPPRGTLYGVYGLLEDHLGCRWFTPGREPHPGPHAAWPSAPCGSAACRCSNTASPTPAIASTATGVPGTASIPAPGEPGGQARRQDPLRRRVLRTHLQSPGAARKVLRPASRVFLAGGRQAAAARCAALHDEPGRDPLVQRGHSPGDARAARGHRVLRLAERLRQLLPVPEVPGAGPGRGLADGPRAGAGEPRGRVDRAASSPAGRSRPWPTNGRGTRPAPCVPRPNVIVRLCSIECCFSHPLATCDSAANRAFREDAAAWAKVADRLWVWDYVTDFSHYLLPFPNQRVRRENIRFFVRHNVRGIFEQDTYDTPQSELAALGGYVTAKFLWNPDYDEQTAFRRVPGRLLRPGRRAHPPLPGPPARSRGAGEHPRGDLGRAG